ncbi:hypothetical protein FHR90_000867 [Endobacter medicaginis]|uniref:OpgC domain-containing protein n=1 Tax=Endobacter medicaginis TaxID=1181271 RepID=A0A839V0H6_9PROT|nr:OpgC domain-containing protein [Endobacter medicaginis]MBB3173049.1 hypothetical protein [Endobacter medicaginis]MCX5474526.1 OpgC domain-containing protein [Endobacter medicaginis]NVN29621.1 OpgC domain-containing protein [Endobacter medicaginis]
MADGLEQALQTQEQAPEPVGREGQAKPKSRRDHRVDALRGIALTMMFVDHMPQNLLNRFTLRNVGFADAAEIFVLLAGFASMLAYGGAIRREGLWIGFERIVRRCIKLYLFQCGLLVAMVFLIRSWNRHVSPAPVDYLEPELVHGPSNLWRVLTLDALPASLNILPLYIVLLLCFPLIFKLVDFNRFLALGVSAALWGMVNLDPQINLPNWLDPDGWFFDPFAWQFLFTLGIVAAAETRRYGGHFPRRWWLIAPCYAYLGFSALQSFPWAQWGLPDLAPLALRSPDKTLLSPLRLLDVLAIFYLVECSATAAWLSETRVGQVLAVYGRHSLEVFSLGTFFDLLGKLAFTRFGNGWAMQIVVNVVGLGALYGLAVWLDNRKQVQKRAGGGITVITSRAAPDGASP